MRKTFLLFMLAVAALGQTPSKATFVANFLAAMNGIISGNPAPGKLSGGFSAQNLPGNYNWISAGQGTPSGSPPNVVFPSPHCSPIAAYQGGSDCKWDNATAINLYTDALFRRGVTEISVNVDTSVWVQAAEYSGSLVSDCTAGAKLAYGATPVSGDGYQCKTLSVYDSMVAHAAGLGMQIRFRPKPDGVVVIAGLTSANTMADYSTFAVPMVAALVARYQSHAHIRMTLLHEAKGGFQGSVPFPATLNGVYTYITAAAAAIRAIPSSIELGAASVTAYPNDFIYMTDASKGYVHTSTLSSCGGKCLDYVETDLYATNCLAEHYPDSITVMLSWTAAAAAVGTPMDIGESAPPAWLNGSGAGVPATTGNCHQTGDSGSPYEGVADLDWQNYGLHTKWARAVVAVASANSIRWWANFSAGATLIWYGTYPDDNAAFGNWPNLVMSHLAENTAVTSLAVMNLSNLPGTAGFTGHAGVTGYASFSAAVPNPAPLMCSAYPTGLPALAGAPALPSNCFAPIYPSPSSTVTVTTSAAFQAALNAATCGQQIQLQTGSTFTGNFIVPGIVCPSNNPVLVAGSAVGALPQYQHPPQAAAGTSAFPHLLTATSASVLEILDNASGWYFAGLEFSLTTGATGVYPIVRMGETTTDPAHLPRYITFDRCIIHPSSVTTNYVRSAIDLNAVYGTVVFSTLFGIVNTSQDTQAVGIGNTTGPFLLTGNDLEASGMGVLMISPCEDAGPPSIPDHPDGTWAQYGLAGCPPPSDGTITRNYFHKPAAWRSNTPAYDVKNHLECKHCKRILVDSNVFDTTWNSAQRQALGANCRLFVQQVCTDLTYTNNMIIHAPQVGVFAGFPSDQTAQRILFRNNLALDISATNWGQFGVSFEISNTHHTTLDHNTVVNSPSTSLNGINFADPPPSSNDTLRITNSFEGYEPFANGMNPGDTMANFTSITLGHLVQVGSVWDYIAGSPAFPAGMISLSAAASSCRTGGKVQDTCVPLDWGLVGMVDVAGCLAASNIAGCALTSGSPFYQVATDGFDVGANVPAVIAATSGVGP